MEMKKNKFSLFCGCWFFILVNFIEGCSTYTGCAYSKKINEDIVFPVLVDNFGRGYRYFNYQNPLIYREDGKIKVIFTPVNDVDGYSLAPDSTFVVVLKCGTNEVLDSYRLRY